MEVLPCSRVAHIERTKKPYNNDIDYYAKRNALRAAEVWMDEYKSHVYMAWNIPMNVSLYAFSHQSCNNCFLTTRGQTFRVYMIHELVMYFLCIFLNINPIKQKLGF